MYFTLRFYVFLKIGDPNNLFKNKGEKEHMFWIFGHNITNKKILWWIHDEYE